MGMGGAGRTEGGLSPGRSVFIDTQPREGRGAEEGGSVSRWGTPSRAVERVQAWPPWGQKEEGLNWGLPPS